MAVPQVAIVGRPNVGKSSLFNWLAGKRIAIVDATAGTTRDRVSSLVQFEDRVVELVDTGGMGIDDVDRLTPQVQQQIQAAIERAAVLLFVVDVRAGLAPLDEEVALRLRSVNKPVLLIANKADSPELEPQAVEFFRLGWDRALCVSSQQNRGKAALLRAVVGHLPPPDGPPPSREVALKLAIVGRRNTGKSTFINRLAREERMIVSEVAGTTRDSVDVRFERDGKVALAIDTAGARRKQSIHSDVEFYSMARAERSIRRADVVLLFLELREHVSKVDKKLAEYILEQHKPAIFVVNKWDLAGEVKTETYGNYIRRVFPSLDYVPIAFISAKTGKNVGAVLSLAEELHQQAGARVGTGDLNRVLRHALEQQRPPLAQNRRPKVFYATQVDTNPPTIVLFTNGPELFSNTYQRYLLKTFRDQLPFGEVPIKLYLRAKRREDAADAEAEPVPGKKGKRTSAEHGKPELWQDV
jgi:GTPase